MNPLSYLRQFSSRPQTSHRLDWHVGDPREEKRDGKTNDYSRGRQVIHPECGRTDVEKQPPTHPDPRKSRIRGDDKNKTKNVVQVNYVYFGARK